MNTFLIVTNLDDSDITQLINNLSNLGPCTRLMPGTIIIRSSLSATEIRDYACNTVQIDNIFVTAVMTPAAWKGIQPDIQIVKRIYDVQN